MIRCKFLQKLPIVFQSIRRLEIRLRMESIPRFYNNACSVARRQIDVVMDLDRQVEC